MPATPKHPSVRARRNKVSTAATLRPIAADADVPPLPEGFEWHPQTLAWWRDIFNSPMVAEYDTSDVHGLLILAVLVNEFWLKPHWTTAAEIRLQGQRFGLSPIDRRRLQWEIDRGEDAEDRTRKRREASKPPAADPRGILHAV